MGHSYPDGTRSLEGIDMELRDGEIVALLGPSGCGKSTFLRIAAGLLQPVAGSLERREDARRPGYVFQSPALLPWRTVRENVELPLQIVGKGRKERRERAGDLLHMVGLADVSSKYPAQLSGGMRMRVSIARALSDHPRLLLLDEPFAALDDLTRCRLQEELLRLRQIEGFAALFVTHNVSEAVFVSDRVLCLTSRPGGIAGSLEIPFGKIRDPDLRTDPVATGLVREATHLLRRGTP